MAHVNMKVVDGVRYRPEDAPPEKPVAPPAAAGPDKPAAKPLRARKH